MKLNKMKPFGTIAGDKFTPEGADRPAAYEQDGRFFDAHGTLISGAAPAQPDDEDVGTDNDIGDDDLPSMTVAELLRQADTMHWRVFKKMGQKVLGPSCPGTKAAMIEALKTAQVEFDARAAKRAKERGLAPQQTTSSVDLAAWARGAREYLWGDVRKAIKSEYGRNVSELDDAVEFLVSQQVITSAQARKDVIREPST